MEFNSLPPEVRLEIISYLPIPEVMKIRLVCKQWNGLINSEFKFKQLLCRQHNAFSCRFRTGCDFGFASTSPFLNHTCKDLKFRRIEYLVADLRPSPGEVKDAFEFLNSFKSLQKAMFSCYVYKKANERVPMNQVVVSLDRLDRLEKLDLQLKIDPPVSVLLNLPSLHYLALDTLDRKITVGYPEKLRTLVVEFFIREGPDYSKFTNLTKIIASLDEVELISANFIERLPSLREIHLKGYEDYKDFRSACGDEEVPCLPAPFGEEKARMFCFGVEISLDELNSEAEHLDNLLWYGPNEATTELIVRNRHRSVDNNQLVTWIFYNPLADQLNDNEMFGVMPQKFPKIREIKINGNVADENRLLKFLDQFEVRRLFFEGDTGLSRSFFEKLVKICPFVRLLSIVRESSMDILSGDLDFIFKFEHLEVVYLSNFKLPINFLTRLLKEMKSISIIAFYELREDYGRYDLVVSSGAGVRLRVGDSLFEPLDRDRNWKGSQERNWKRNLLNFVDDLNRRLKVDGYVCPKKFLVVLRQMDIEEQNGLFMMRSFVYEQRHSICLPKEQVRLVNCSS